MSNFVGTRSRWYGSLYWRIGISFVVLVVAVLVIQSAVFNFVMSRTRLPGRSVNSVAAIVAADLGAALAQEPSLELVPYFRTEYGEFQLPIVVLMKDGRMAANTTRPLREDLRQSIQALLSGADIRQQGKDPIIGGPPTVMAPIQVAGELRGMVVLPRAEQRSPVARDRVDRPRDDPHTRQGLLPFRRLARHPARAGRARAAQTRSQNRP